MRVNIVDEVTGRLRNASYDPLVMRADVIALLKVIQDYDLVLNSEVPETVLEKLTLKALFNSHKLLKGKFDREVEKHEKTQEQVFILMEERKSLLDFIKNRGATQERNPGQALSSPINKLSDA